MALKQRETTRWTARVGTWIVAAVVFVGEVLKAFFNFKRGDEFLTKGEKTAETAIRQLIYIGLDYGLWFVSIGIFTTLKLLGFSFPWVFSALWMYDFVVAGAFVLFYEKTGRDMSLGEDFRRATDIIRNKSRLAGYVAMTPIVIRGVFWTGPEKIVVFFRKEIGTTDRVVTVLLVLAAIQALLWTVLYSFGYGLVVG